MWYKRQKVKYCVQNNYSDVETIITDDTYTIIYDIGNYLDKEAINILNDIGSVCVGGYMYSIMSKTEPSR